jgi:hypothetical protein
MVVGSKFRSLWARLTLLVVDDDGMSTVEYANAELCTPGDWTGFLKAVDPQIHPTPDAGLW